MSFTLVTGGCRSGKSLYAEQIAESLCPERLYVATMEIRDDETRARVRLHQQRRGSGWRLYECPATEAPVLCERLPAITRPGEALLFDCLTLWTASCMVSNTSLQVFRKHCTRLFRALSALSCPVVMVNSEVGMGLVPPSPEARLFRDMAGTAAQLAAATANTVIFMVSGIPLAVKGTLPLRAN